ncbi:MAG: hypothetical protein EA409_10095 [Saprospirales bacterium]|nr:MAG: hypothetical protein EA409_10095 [Saprospirales bacterium]
MEITRERIEPTVEQVRLQLHPSDYQEDYKRELAKAAKSTDFKGFRKGKAPISFVQKTQGTSILYNLIFKKLNDQLEEYLKSEGIDYIFSPIPAESQKQYSFNPLAREEFEFVFDLFMGISLDETKGWAEDNEYEYFVVKDVEKDIDEEVERLRNVHGTFLDEENVVPEGSTLLSFEINAANNSEESFDVNPFNMRFLWTEFTEDFAEKLKSLKVGDELVASINEAILADFQRNVEKEYLQKNSGSEGGEESETAEIPENFNNIPLKWILETVSVRKLADLNEEFFKNISGPDIEIKSEEDMRGLIEKNILHDYQQRSNQILFHRFHKRVKESNELSIPDRFVEEFILKDQEMRALTEEEKKGVIWEIITNKLIEHFKLDVTEEEIRQQLFFTLQSYFGGQTPPQFAETMLERMIKDEDARRDAVNRIITTKLIFHVSDALKKVETEVSIEELEGILRAEFPETGDEEE